jgi:carbamoyltransferase
VSRQSLPERVASLFGQNEFHGDVHYVEHHLAHLSSAFFVSPFEKALALSVDGFGDFASTAWGKGEGTSIAVDGRVHFPHSLGIFYEAVTRFLGFMAYGDEYKVMGLASYGESRYQQEMETLIRLKPGGRFALNLEYFTHHLGEETISWEDCEPTSCDHYSPALPDLLGPPREADEPVSQRHMDIARSAQAVYEKVFFHAIRNLHSLHAIDQLVLSGGCAFNSVANGRIRENTPIRRTYVQAAAGDAGGALGAALYTWHVRMGETRSDTMEHAYWGPEYSTDDISSRLDARSGELTSGGCQWRRVPAETLTMSVASAIAAGKVVGWFQGRMEWGPRALGNRSILCDPRRGDMREILNRKIKHRELFRPFAPSILREHAHDWFEHDDDVPFMMKVLQVRVDRRERVPAVTHVDGSGRLQTVERHQNPLFYALIEQFNSLTGVPMLLNTSFNQSEPIVCSVDDAINCFLRTEMDILVLGENVVVKAVDDGSSRDTAQFDEMFAPDVCCDVSVKSI